MNGWFDLLPQVLLLAPLLSGATLFLWKSATRFRRMGAAAIQIILALLSILGLWKAAEGNIMVTLAGSWLAPYGIVLVVDVLSAFMLAAVNLVFLATTLYGYDEEPMEAESVASLPLLFFLQTGVALTLLTGDFFNLFVSVEIMLTASYALMVISSPRRQIYRAFSYVILSMTASFLFLLLAGAVYGFTGHLNMGAISESLSGRGNEPAVIALGLLALLIFGLKSGVFPLYFWLPDSYPILPAGLAALFGGILTKVGIYVLMRLFITVFPHNLETVHVVMGVLAALTMLLGVIGAVGKETIKGVLSYHILSQTGYMIFALALFTPQAIAAGLYFVVHNVWVKSSLFMIGGVSKRIYRTNMMKNMGGLWQVAPMAGALFFIQAMSLAGIPPFSGFWGKYWIFAEGMRMEFWLLVFVGAVTSFLTLLSMVKIWTMVFMGPSKAVYDVSCRGLLASSTILVIASLSLSFGAEYAIGVSKKAGLQLFDPSQYVEAVYSASGKGGRS